MTRRPISGDLQFIVQLTQEAGSRLLRFFRQPAELLAVDFKGPRDLVTAADLAAEELLLNALRDRFRGDEVLAEESASTNDADLGRSRVWIVDPLDGTTNFAHGHPLFAISVALWEGPQPLLGVVHAPALGETYWAERGSGAYRDGVPIRVAPPGPLGNALLATGFSYGRAELDDGALGPFEALLRNAREIRRGGSACLDLAHTAAGIFAGFWEYFLKPYDVAAGALLVLEAGGVVSDCRGGTDYLRGGSVVAGTPEIHEQLLKVLGNGPAHPGQAG